MENKCVIIGDKNSGKTELLINLFTIETGNNTPTVMDNYVFKETVNEKNVELSIFDTASSKEYDTLRPLCYPGTDIFIICFSLSSITTFKNIETKWLPELQQHSQNVPIILVGINKEDDSDSEDDDIIVSKKEAVKLAKKIKTKYLECSLSNDEEIKNIFKQSINVILSNNKNKNNKNNNCTIS
eukprot:TRINITY_DN3674_c0_g1_i1.p1 TRINITY_DN3674_c0_g1~~TRINITY_DN3674_c0_g1_i1.p1  ORF type:complete len:184 (-),score=52.10 TRINITY_DN3674_c0_g1_i1:17-568(-)